MDQHPHTETDTDRSAPAGTGWLDEALSQEPHTSGSSALRSPANDQSAEIRPTGVSWATVIIGTFCLLFAGAVLAYQVLDLRVDWSLAVPAAVVGGGLLMALLGLLGLHQRAAEDPPR